jgi:hypothetical protein
VSKVTVAGGSELVALSPDSVFNLADKSSYLGNCMTTPIKNINGVYPYAPGEGGVSNDGNVFIVGIKPIIFYGDSETSGTLKVLTPGLTLDSLCTSRHRLLPPVSISSFTQDNATFKDSYYNKPALPADGTLTPPRPSRLASNFYSAQRPEYYYWPQFINEEYYAYWNITSPSTPVIQSLAPSAGGFVVTFRPPVNDGGTSVAHYEYSLNMGTYTAFAQPSTNNTLHISGLPSARTYSVRIRAVNALGVLGAASNSLTATTI